LGFIWAAVLCTVVTQHQPTGLDLIRDANASSDGNNLADNFNIVV
jgi:hypothetical protein